ncbi:MAG: hypothetical protein U9O98_07525 [Asgard group archaeon]|nr:hypothetical protein [Asgard group archaeon]
MTRIKIVKRSFHWEQDFEAVRVFLINLYTITKSLHIWLPMRFENIKYGPCGSAYRKADDNDIKIW